jgi:hypothetical protein
MHRTIGRDPPADKSADAQLLIEAEIMRNGYEGDITAIGKSFTSPIVETGPGITEPQNRRVVVELGL